MIDAMADFFGNVGDSIAEFFGNVYDIIDESISGDSSTIVAVTTVIVIVASIVSLSIWG